MSHRPRSFMRSTSDDQASSSVLHVLPLVTALVVDPLLDDAFAMASALEACRFHVTVAETFPKAKARLNARPPDVLVTAIRLAEYNGLQLVLSGKAISPRLSAIVVSPAPDPVLQADAEAMGATFVVKPVAANELTTAVFRTMFRDRSGTPAEPLRAPFDRRVRERRANVIPLQIERRRTDRRRDLATLMRVVARNNG